MSWRLLVIRNRAKLDLKQNHIVVRSEDETKKVFIGDVSTLIIEHTGISITAALLSELIKNKIKVIFCDEKRNPESELLPYYGSHDTSEKLRRQVNWTDEIKCEVWTEIISEKIRNQRNLLLALGKSQSELLDGYINEIQLGDITNREGHSAKVYFNALYGLDFTRTKDSNLNSALDYGYTILLSSFNREIVKNGYITQLGIFHDNMFNQFNLGSDLMEPFRPIVDAKAYMMDLDVFANDEKLQLIDILNEYVYIEGKLQYLNNAIGIYCRSVFEALNERDSSLIKFYRYEL